MPAEAVGVRSGEAGGRKDRTAERRRDLDFSPDVAFEL